MGCWAEKLNYLLYNKLELSSFYHKKLKFYRLIEGNYQPRGHVINLGNLPVYEAPDNANSRRMIIIIHDIFGGFLETNMMQVTDVMALQGFRTVLPNFFRGEGWDRSIPVEWVQFIVFQIQQSWTVCLRSLKY